MRRKLANRLQQYRQLQQREEESRGREQVRRQRREAEAKAAEQRRAFLEERGWRRREEKVWEKSETRSLRFPPVPGGLFLPGTPSSGHYRFFDFETTGLSGGAGTYIFLAGFGEYLPEQESIRVDRLLLEDLDGEPQFIRALEELSDGGVSYVSYNGKGYDRHILRSRGLLNGVTFAMPYQIDLLYQVRRIWGRVFPDCRLQTAERELLGVERSGDIPGAEIPACYFRFIAAEDFSCMARVIEHHLQDIVSLAELAGYMERAAGQPEELLASEEAQAAMGRLLLRERPEKGRELLHSAFEQGSMQAGRQLVLAYRREKRYAEMGEVLERMWGARRGLFQGVNLAKYYEHRRREPRRALEVVGEMLTAMPYLEESVRRALLHRKRRLERKTGSQSDHPGAGE
jgi:uncharacterized protein YprB with RNaseH-like and TPR domain